MNNSGTLCIVTALNIDISISWWT